LSRSAGPPSTRRSHSYKDREVEIDDRGNRTDEVPRLTEAPQATSDAVLGAADDDVERRDQHETKPALHMRSLVVVAGDVHEDLLEVRIGGRKIRAHRELRKRSVGDLATAIHDDDPGTDLFHEMQKMRRDQDSGACACTRNDGRPHASNADRIEAG